MMAKQILHGFTVLPVKELALVAWPFLLPYLYRLGDIVRNPDPESTVC